MEWTSSVWAGGARELFTFIVMAEINIPQLQAVEDNTCLRQLYSSRNHDPSTLFLPRLVSLLWGFVLEIELSRLNLDNILNRGRVQIFGFWIVELLKEKQMFENQKEIKRVGVAERCLTGGGNGSSSSSAHLHTIIAHAHSILQHYCTP